MRTIKKTVILFLISLVLVLGLSFVVSAVGSFTNSYYDLGNVTVSLADSNASFSTSYLGVQYLRNNTYKFNITISFTKGKTNVTVINFTLPNQIVYNGTQGTNRTGAPTFSQAGQSIAWFLATGLMNGSGTGGTSVNRTAIRFGFSARVNSSTQRSINITIKVTHNGSRYKNTVKLANNLTLDGQAPSMSSAKTRGASKINITFSERMNGTTIDDTGFIVNITTRGALRSYNVSNLSLGSATGTNATLTLVTGKYFITNETPPIYTNKTTSGSDLAGNRIKKGASVTPSDGAAPGLVHGATGQLNSSMYSYTNKTLTLLFNETVNRTSLTAAKIVFVSYGTPRTYTLSGIHITSNTTDDQTNKGDRLKVILSNRARDQISAWRATSLNLSLLSNAIKDMSGNSVKLTNSSLKPFVNDTTRPNITSVTYSYYNRTIVMTWNDTMVNNVTAQSKGYNITIANASNITNRTTGFIRLSGGVVRPMRNATILNFTLTFAQRDKIENWSKTVLYIAWNSSEFQDLAGNKAYRRNNNSGLVLATYTRDTSPPSLKLTPQDAGSGGKVYNVSGVYINISSAYKNRTGRFMYNVTVLWNETMDVQRNATVSAVVGSTAIPVLFYTNTPTNWLNNTAFRFRLNLSALSNTDGVGKIYIRAWDIRGTVSSNISVRSFRVDTTIPTVATKAYYQDVDYTHTLNNWRNLTGDYIFVDFSENVSVRIENTVALTNGTFNVSYVQGHTLQIDKMSLANVSTNASRIRLEINDTTAANNSLIVVRGVYARRSNTSLNASGINVKSAQHTIADWAGNYAVPGTAVDIADNMVSFAANISSTVVTPFCVNITLMNNQLSSVGGTGCRSYTTGSWASLSGGSMSQLVAYSCNFNKKLDLFVYTRGNTSCAVTDSSTTLSAGWNLIGVNGVRNSTLNRWLASLDNGGGDASGVTYVWKSIDTAPQKVDNTGTTFETTSIDPLTTYWAFVENPPSGSSWSFSGTGFY